MRAMWFKPSITFMYPSVGHLMDIGDEKLKWIQVFIHGNRMAFCSRVEAIVSQLGISFFSNAKMEWSLMVQVQTII